MDGETAVGDADEVDIEAAATALAAAEGRRRRATDRMAETERRRAAGEIDDATAERLFRIYEVEVIKAIEDAEEAASHADPDVEVFLVANPAKDANRLVTAKRVAVVAVGFIAFVAIVAGAQFARRDDKATPPTLTGAETLTQLESAVSKQPNVPAMRIFLAQQYLNGCPQDAPCTTQATPTNDAVKKAQEQVHAALQIKDISGSDKHNAVVLLGWTTSLSGQPREGQELLAEASNESPDDADALFYLGLTRLLFLNDSSGAVDAFTKALATPNLPDDGRAKIQKQLDKAQLKAAGGSPDIPGAVTPTTAPAPATTAKP